MKLIGVTERGYHIYEDDTEQGIQYVSDEIGGGVVLFHTALVSIESIELALKHFKELK